MTASVPRRRHPLPAIEDDVDPLSLLMRSARMAIDAASDAAAAGKCVEPHLRAASYFLGRATECAVDLASGDAEDRFCQGLVTTMEHVIDLRQAIAE
jgi:hypothetical protein